MSNPAMQVSQKCEACYVIVSLVRTCGGLVSKKNLLPSAHKYTLRDFLGPVVNGKVT